MALAVDNDGLWIYLELLGELQLHPQLLCASSLLRASLIVLVLRQ